MDVLLIGVDNPVGSALQDAIAQWGRHRVQPLTSAAASRWTRERHAKKAARKGLPDAIVDLRLAWQLTAGEELEPLDVERCHWLAKACEHSDMRYVLLSSDQVFSGRGGRSLREDDPTDAYSESGLRMIEAEERALQAAPGTLVLRSGPLFSSSGSNIFTAALERMSGEGNVLFDHRHRLCPVMSDDMARVISAILDQLSVGTEASGIYHYCSGDRTTEFEFAAALLAAAGEYKDYESVTISPGDSDDPAQLRCLDCTRLRDGFAIKQVPWRASVSAAVLAYFQRLQEDQKQ